MFSATLGDIFNKFDLVISNSIDMKEFKGFLEILGKTVKNELEWKANYCAKFNSFEDAMTAKGFREWWKA